MGQLNTMVVDHISANKFIPWETYQDVYLISREELANRGIHPSLHARYLNLRKQIELKYCSFLLEEQTSQIDVTELNEYCRILSDPAVEVDPQATKLPNPLKPAVNPAIERSNVQTLLDDGGFLRSLRKIHELKAALDSQNQAIATSTATQSQDPLKDVKTGIIYAQSIIQMDGDIVNRYDEKLLTHEYKDIILDLHLQGVSAGQNQWHGLVEFLVNLVELLMNRNYSIKDFFKWN